MGLREDSPRKTLSRWLFAIGVTACAWSGAAAAETYLILSLVGDRFTVVTAEQRIGSNPN